MDVGERSPIPFPKGPLLPPWPRLLAWAAAGYAGFLLYATHHPNPEELLGSHPPSDKTLHFLAYGALAGIVAAAVAARGGWTFRTAASVFVLLALFAAADEATQPLFGRYADVVDWAFDGIGMLVSLAAFTAGLACLGGVRPEGTA